MPHMTTICQNTDPYPEVMGPGDPDTVRFLMMDYAGKEGELTAIMQYTYQHMFIDSDKNAFSDAMLAISIVEMRHMELLGEAIKTLGGNPLYGDGTYFWQANAVDYSDTMPEMLEANIKGEISAIKNYERHAAETKNESVRALLLRIVEDEKLHLQFFEKELMKTEKC